jgi:hypothetical protein
MTANPAMFPTFRTEHFELLRYYLSKTANSMGNGSTDRNPFLAELIPLAFSSPLILHLILTQSAAQRAIESSQPARAMAQNYYIQALRLCRNVVSHSMIASPTDNLYLAAGLLVFCYIEVGHYVRRGSDAS